MLNLLTKMTLAHKRKFYTGKNARDEETAPKIVGVERDKTAEVFVTRLPPELTQEDLSAYILAILNLNATVFKQTTRHDDEFSSFHVSCICENPKIFMDPNLWPECWMYRRWYPPCRKPYRNGGNNSDDG